MSVYELYKPVRNKISEFPCWESLAVIWAYCQFLQQAGFEFPDDVETSDEFKRQKHPQKWVAEWELELLAKEIVINTSTAGKTGRTLRAWQQFSKTINRLKDLENGIFGVYGSTENVLLELYRMAHRQFVWQGGRPDVINLTRYFKIYNQPELDRICQARLGLTVRELYLCGIMFLGAHIRRPMVRRPSALPIAELTDDKVENFLLFAGRDRNELSKLLKGEQLFDERFLYAYNSLREFPLILSNDSGGEFFYCPLPTLLFWRITGGLYYDLVDDPGFSKPFGDSFQAYVGWLIEQCCVSGSIRSLHEESYGPKKSRKDTVDWIAYDQEAAAFVECKARRPTWNAKAGLKDTAPIEAAIESLADAIVQVYKTLRDHLGGEYPSFSPDSTRKIYPVVVTLENWYVLGPLIRGILQKAVDVKLAATDVPTEFLDKYPYSVCPVADFEESLPVMDEIGIGEFFGRKLNDTEMVEWDWRAFLFNQFPDRKSSKSIFERDFHDIFAVNGMPI